jgi:hypothetical protein
METGDRLIVLDTLFDSAVFIVRLHSKFSPFKARL